MNRVTLVGRITKDPELKYTGSNIAVVSFTVAVNRTYTNQNGEREADFVNCVVWRKQAENLARYVGKGSLIGVDGRIQTRSYDREGTRVYVTEVVAETVQFLETRRNNDSNNQFNQPQQGGYSQPMSNNQPANPFMNNSQTIQVDKDPFEEFGNMIDISDDDLPF